jgi:hypothetical protein
VVKSQRFRACKDISIPKDAAALERITAGTAKPDDWIDVPKGEPCDPPEKMRAQLKRGRLVKEVKGGD